MNTYESVTIEMPVGEFDVQGMDGSITKVTISEHGLAVNGVLLEPPRNVASPSMLSRIERWRAVIVGIEFAAQERLRTQIRNVMFGDR